MAHPIKEWMDKTGTRQFELARRSGVPAQRICDVLHRRLRRFNPEHAESLSKITGIPRDVLLLKQKRRVPCKRQRAA